MEPVLYPDVLRMIRSYLPLKEAHRFRTVNHNYLNFTNNELEKLYSNQNILYLSTIGDLIGLQYLLPRDSHIHDELFKFAAQYGQYKVVKYLVEHGANIRAKDDEALRIAVHYGQYEVVKYLVEHGANIHAEYDEALRIAAENGDYEMVKYLLEHDANVHANDDEALKYAAENGYYEVVKYLIEYGADIHVWDDEALRKAARNGRYEVVKYLVEHGARIHALKDYALSGGECAALSSGSEALRRGMVTPTGALWHPGGISLREIHYEIVKYLVEHGANIHADNDYALSGGECAALSSGSEALRRIMVTTK